MIFCTIGTQSPFDRFIKIVDEIAAESDEEFVAQILGGAYEPKNIKTVGLLSPDGYKELCRKARIIVAHAGIGTIISALQLNKPIVVFPRIAKLGEHRNEHQTATAEMFDKMGLIYKATDKKTLEKFLLQKDLPPLKEIGNFASNQLINEVRSIIR